MRNYTLIFSFLFISLTVNCQDAKLKTIISSYSLGENIKKLIEQNKFSELKSDFENAEKINTLISLIQSEKSKSGEYELSSDIYFNPDLKKYVLRFTALNGLKQNLIGDSMIISISLNYLSIMTIRQKNLVLLEEEYWIKVRI